MLADCQTAKSYVPFPYLKKEELGKYDKGYSIYELPMATEPFEPGKFSLILHFDHANVVAKHKNKRLDNHGKNARFVAWDSMVLIKVFRCVPVVAQA